MNSISRSSIKKVLKIAEQIRLIRDPIILKKKKNKIFNQSWKKEKIKALFKRNANLILFYNLNKI